MIHPCTNPAVLKHSAVTDELIPCFCNTLSVRECLLYRFKTPTSAVSFSGIVGNLNVHLAQNGRSEEYDICKIGTSAALLTTYLAVDAFKPDLVLSAGTAGGFKRKGAAIASIYI